MEYRALDAGQTAQAAAELAQKLQPGDVVALYGELGAGKTTFVQALGKALGIKGPITSPTFALVCEYYDGQLPLYHFDLYRINEEESLCEIGFFDYLSGDGVCAVEWSENVEAFLPIPRYEVRLAYAPDGQGRVITVEKKEEAQ